MQLLDEYFALQKAIYEYFGYVEDWVVIPLDDCREAYWYLTDDAVKYAKTEEELLDEDKQFGNEIYTQRFLPKYIYRGTDFTMICVDTHTDGNKFLQIFDNAKERPDTQNRIDEANDE